jgi:hypothetical protein
LVLLGLVLLGVLDVLGVLGVLSLLCLLSLRLRKVRLVGVARRSPRVRDRLRKRVMRGLVLLSLVGLRLVRVLM